MDNGSSTQEPSQAESHPGEEESKADAAAAAPVDLSQKILQNYRSKIMELDPNHTIVTLAMEDIGEFDIHSIFPDLLMYEPPNPDYDDPYFDEAEYGRIVAITKLITNKIVLKKRQRLSRKRKIDGEPVLVEEPEQEEESVKTLPRNERYDTSPLVSRKYIHFELRACY